MINLELLFEATKLSGDSTFYHIAVNHADRTLKEHFRTNGSCYHVIDYSLADGMVRHRQTAQGYADESTWSRGIHENTSPASQRLDSLLGYGCSQYSQ